jgi:hypothetical protein
LRDSAPEARSAMRKLIFITSLVLGGCATSVPAPTYKPFVSSSVTAKQLVEEHRQCVTAELNRIVTENYAGTREASYIPMDKLAGEAIDQCIPSLQYQPADVQKTAREDIRDQARTAETNEMRTWDNRQLKVTAAKSADDQIKLKAEEPTAIADWRNCLVSDARQLAQRSQEPAEAIARATFAACRSQRDNLIAIHQRYGDSQFGAEVMDRAEQLSINSVMLVVMQTRAATTVPELPQQPATPPSREDQSI